MPLSRDERIALLDSLVGRLIDAATYVKSMDNPAYREERDLALNDAIVGTLVPAWMRNCRDLAHFRSLAQTKGDYKDRRRFINDAFQEPYLAAERGDPGSQEVGDVLRTPATIGRLYRQLVEAHATRLGF